MEMVLTLLRGGSLEELSRVHRVTIQELNTWRDLFLEKGASGFKSVTKGSNREHELERIIGRQQMEIELLKKKMRPYGQMPENS